MLQMVALLGPDDRARPAPGRLGTATELVARTCETPDLREREGVFRAYHLYWSIGADYCHIMATFRDARRGRSRSRIRLNIDLQQVTALSH